MTQHPSTPTVGFKRHFTSFVVDGEAVYLVSERGVCTVSGRLAQLLAPLLDGTRTAEQIGAELAGTVPGERVDGALESLVKGGWVTPTDPSADRAAAAFFEMAGLDGDTALAALSAATVRIESYGAVDAGPVAAALRAAGAGWVTVVPGDAAADQDQVAPAPDLVVALVDDYLHPGLADRNRAALADGVPWLITRPVGSLLWVGPVFVPDAAAATAEEATGCWECLAHRLSANRQSLSYLQHRLGRPQPLSTAVAGLAPTVAAGGQLAAVEAAKWLAGARPAAAAVLTLDTVTLEAERHQLVRRPQCPACGDDTLMARRQLQPVTFQPRPKVFTGDGGHRSTTPEEMLETYRPQLSPVTGVVTTLVPAQHTPAGLRVYVAGQNLARQVGDLRQLRTGLRSVSCGKGRTDVQARASALCEAMERYSGVFRGDEPRRTRHATRSWATPPCTRRPACSSASGSTRERDGVERPRRSRSTSCPSRSTRTPDRLDAGLVADPAADRATCRPRSATSTTRRPAAVLRIGDSNGNAAGNTLEEAILQGFLELVERDAVALWWYNRVRRPARRPRQLRRPVPRRGCGDLRGPAAARSGCSTSPPTWASRSSPRSPGGPTSRPRTIMLGFGAHLDPRIALLRARHRDEPVARPPSRATARGRRRLRGAVDDPETRAGGCGRRPWPTSPICCPTAARRPRGPRPLTRAWPATTWPTTCAPARRLVEAAGHGDAGARPDPAGHRPAGGQGDRPRAAALLGPVRPRPALRRARPAGLAGAPAAEEDLNPIPMFL